MKDFTLWKLKILGLYKEPTTDELCELLAKRMFDEDSSLEKEQEEKLFESLKHIEGLQAYLQDTANRDIRRYFGASDDKERNLTRGAFARTVYFLSRIRQAGEDKLHSR